MKADRIILSMALAVVLCSCSNGMTEAGMYPDYSGTTVPCNIAPLNFHYTGVSRATTVFRAGEMKTCFYGRSVRWSERKWKKMVEAARGDSIYVHSSVLGDWAVAVSADSIDNYLTYRLIEPGYEVWDRVEIRERDIRSFDERTLCDWQHTDNACMNCHIHKGRNSMFYLRGKGGGAILGNGSSVRKLSLVNADMASGTVYGDLHPSGRWGVFSTNKIVPAFHTLGSSRMEVYDKVSDLTIADFDGNRMLNDKAYARGDKLETFPCFSADGKSVFFCIADTLSLPREVERLKYSICRTSFNPETGALGQDMETIWDAAANNASACHPKASPDGKWLMFTRADYGTFPIWHRECDLCLLDLQSGSQVAMEGVNSDVSDTYHSWSSNSRWFVFASKRDDGQYGKPFICHIDENGLCSKPFILPQKNPYHYEKTLKSYNIPDLGTTRAPYDAEMTGHLKTDVEAEIFE